MLLGLPVYSPGGEGGNEKVEGGGEGLRWRGSGELVWADWEWLMVSSWGKAGWGEEGLGGKEGEECRLCWHCQSAHQNMYIQRT